MARLILVLALLVLASVPGAQADEDLGSQQPLCEPVAIWFTEDPSFPGGYRPNFWFRPECA